jgi:DNA-binding MarR family transcriptional regulator
MPGRRTSEPDAAEALVAVAPLASRWIARLLAGHEPPLTVPQFLAVRAIARERLSAGELAQRAGISEPAVSQLLAGLTGSGLVERRPRSDDRRRHELALSPAGEDVYRSAERLLHDRVGALLGDLPRPEADALARLLSRVETLLSGAPPPRRPPAPPRHPPPPPPRKGPRP